MKNIANDNCRASINNDNNQIFFSRYKSISIYYYYYYYIESIIKSFIKMQFFSFGLEENNFFLT